MTADIIISLLQLFSEYAHPEKVRYRNKESVNEIIKQLIKDGPANLQVYWYIYHSYQICNCVLFYDF